MKEMNDYNRTRLTDTENELLVTSSERKGGSKGRGRELRGTNYYVQDKQATRIYCTAQGI